MAAVVAGFVEGLVVSAVLVVVVLLQALIKIEAVKAIMDILMYSWFFIEMMLCMESSIQATVI